MRTLMAMPPDQVSRRRSCWAARAAPTASEARGNTAKMLSPSPLGLTTVPPLSSKADVKGESWRAMTFFISSGTATCSAAQPRSPARRRSGRWAQATGASSPESRPATPDRAEKDRYDGGSAEVETLTQKPSYRRGRTIQPATLTGFSRWPRQTSKPGAAGKSALS